MSKPFATIIIDDEVLALNRLKRLLEKYNAEIKIIGEATDGQQGLELIEKFKPTIIFLDVEMPIMNGFEMLAKLKHQPKVIFTTAFEEYAIKAFEQNSIDYLLKPIEVARLDKTIQKLNFFQTETSSINPIQLEQILNSIKPKNELKSIPVKIGDKILLIKNENIIYFEAKDKFVYIVTEDNREYLTDFTLTHLEEKLQTPFIRVHRAFIVNCDKIKEFYKGFNSSYILVMMDANQTRINTGRAYLTNIQHLVNI